MKCCTFCSNEAEMLFKHLNYDIGSLCLECYMKIQATCSTCGESFMPHEVLEGVMYRAKAKFIGMSEMNIIVCDCCHEAIQQAFPEQME